MKNIVEIWPSLNVQSVEFSAKKLHPKETENDYKKSQEQQEWGDWADWIQQWGDQIR